MTVRRLAIAVVALVLVLQFVPYGHAHRNPPVSEEPQWDSPETRTLFFRACRDCHSNETVWPWYSNVAPVSWLVTRDVNHGREHLNVSDWNRAEEHHGEEAAEMVEKDYMPLWFYLPLHPEAQLSPEDKKRLIRGLEQTFGTQDHGH